MKVDQNVVQFVKDLHTFKKIDLPRILSQIDPAPDTLELTNNNFVLSNAIK